MRPWKSHNGISLVELLVGIAITIGIGFVVSRIVVATTGNERMAVDSTDSTTALSAFVQRVDAKMASRAVVETPWNGFGVGQDTIASGHVTFGTLRTSHVDENGSRFSMEFGNVCVPAGVLPEIAGHGATADMVRSAFRQEGFTCGDAAGLDATLGACGANEVPAVRVALSDGKSRFFPDLISSTETSRRPLGAIMCRRVAGGVLELRIALAYARVSQIKIIEQSRLYPLNVDRGFALLIKPQLP